MYPCETSSSTERLQLPEGSFDPHEHDQHGVGGFLIRDGCRHDGVRDDVPQRIERGRRHPEEPRERGKDRVGVGQVGSARRPVCTGRVPDLHHQLTTSIRVRREHL